MGDWALIAGFVLVCGGCFALGVHKMYELYAELSAAWSHDAEVAKLTSIDRHAFAGTDLTTEGRALLERWERQDEQRVRQCRDQADYYAALIPEPIRAFYLRRAKPH